MLRHKVGDIIYLYDITAAEGGPCLSSYIPPCDSGIVDTLSKTYVKKSDLMI